MLPLILKGTSVWAEGPRGGCSGTQPRVNAVMHTASGVTKRHRPALCGLGAAAGGAINKTSRVESSN